MDAIVTKFLAENMLTIAVSLAVLKGLAEVSTWTWDEKIIDIINNALNAFTQRRAK